MLSGLVAGRAPDIMASAEVNSLRLTEALAAELAPREYQALWEGSVRNADAGIGVLLDPACVQGPDGVEVYPADRAARVRYLLLQLRVKQTQSPFLFIVNHWKSRMKKGGVNDEQDRRDTAERLGDRLGEETTIADAILVGDFNAEPCEVPFGPALLRASRHFSGPRRWRESPVELYNPMWRWLPEADWHEVATCADYSESRPTASLGPGGRFLFDQLMVSGGLLRGERLQLSEASIRLYHDEATALVQPRTRRIVPRRWQYDPLARAGSGCSDHLPLVFTLLVRSDAP